MMMSIWNFPVFGCEKLFFAVETMCSGPAGSPISAWTVIARIPCVEDRVEARVEAFSVEDADV